MCAPIFVSYMHTQGPGWLGLKKLCPQEHEPPQKRTALKSLAEKPDAAPEAGLQLVDPGPLAVQLRVLPPQQVLQLSHLLPVKTKHYWLLLNLYLNSFRIVIQVSFIVNAGTGTYSNTNIGMCTNQGAVSHCKFWYRFFIFIIVCIKKDFIYNFLIVVPLNCLP